MIKRSHGFALLEVLITIVILALGLLGLAGLQNRLLVHEIESYQRTQALMIQQDMVNRLMSTSRQMAVDYAGIVAGGAGAAPDCTGQTEAARDACEWDRLLRGASESMDGTNIGAIRGAVGCVADLGGDQYRVSVAWQGLNPTLAPAVACGAGQFGADDRLRRVITEVVRKANLSCDPATPGTC